MNEQTKSTATKPNEQSGLYVNDIKAQCIAPTTVEQWALSQRAVRGLFMMETLDVSGKSLFDMNESCLNVLRFTSTTADNQCATSLCHQITNGLKEFRAPLDSTSVGYDLYGTLVLLCACE